MEWRQCTSLLFPTDLMQPLRFALPLLLAYASLAAAFAQCDSTRDCELGLTCCFSRGVRIPSSSCRTALSDDLQTVSREYQGATKDIVPRRCGALGSSALNYHLGSLTIPNLILLSSFLSSGKSTYPATILRNEILVCQNHPDY